MPKPPLLYLHKEKTRHGTIVWYFHRRNEPRIRIRGAYGSAEFLAAYQAALAGQSITVPSKSTRLSLVWCIEQFMASSNWAGLASESRKQLSYQFIKIKDNAGKHFITAITRKHILDGQDRRRAVPSDANKYVRAMSLLCRYAVDQEWLKASPVHGISKLKTSKTGEGFHTWTDEDHISFEARWPIGTRERLAYEIFKCTGLRRSDAVRLGRQHVKDGQFSIRTQKTGMVVTATMLPELLTAISATPTGELTYLSTMAGRPFASSASFGKWFSDACHAAGIKGSAHGIRKALAAQAATGDDISSATEAQLNSLFGWSHGSRESATYVQKASRAKMAVQAGNILTRTRPKGAGDSSAKPLKDKGK